MLIKTNRICLIITVFIVFSPFLSLAGTVDLPKTGQITSYCSGDDGDIQAGVPWPEPRFTDNGDGTVTDNLTGLMWLKNANCANTIAYDPNGTGDGRMKWHNALDFVAGINDETYSTCGAGYTDWRLPNINELESLINAGESNSAIWLNAQGFTNGLGEYYWSSTTWLPDTNGAWVINMGSGSMLWSNKYWDSTVFFAWPVRGVTNGPAKIWRTGQTISYAQGDDGDIQAGVPWPEPRFTDNGDGTVTDNLTGLMWLKDAFCFGHNNWQAALNMAEDFNANPDNYNYYCQEYTATNYTWRLPNRKEYNSLTDFSQSQPSIALPIGHPFLRVFRFHNWSSTTYTGDTDKAWFKFMENGHMNSYLQTSVFPNWLVRAGVKVVIDIKPGSDQNIINLSSAGVIPVAILSSETFDATMVDPGTVSLAGARVKMAGKSEKYLSHEEDVNSDGLLDFVCQVYTTQFAIEPGESTAVLEAETFDGTLVSGEDTVNIVPDN